MKINRRFFFILGLLVSFSSFAQSVPEQPKDPICGDWLFHGDHQVMISNDGKVEDKGRMYGVWRFLKNPEVERKYQIIWEKGVYIDNLRLSRDGKTLEGKSKKGESVKAIRALVETTPK